MVASNQWKNELRFVTTLQLDAINPRFEIDSPNPSQADLVRLLFDQEDAMEIAESIARNGFFANEPLLGVWEGDQIVILEGNRRLAALKALRNPKLLEGREQRKLAGLAKEIEEPKSIHRVPVVIAPNRRAADALLVARHTQRMQKSWTEANRSRFILTKLKTGYTEQMLYDEFGFTQTDVKEARFFRAMVDVAKSLDLAPVYKDLVVSGNFSFTTLERILESSGGRQLQLQKDDQYGFVVHADPAAFKRAMAKIVEDIIDKPKEVNSRTLNTDAALADYVTGLGELLPVRKKDKVTPAELLPAAQQASPAAVAASGSPPTKRARKPSTTAVPKSFKAHHGSEKLLLILKELYELDRDRKKWASAVLLRVFLELSIVEYLKRHKKFAPLIAQLKADGAKLERDMPTMKQLVKAILVEAKARLEPGQYTVVQKALSYQEELRLNIAELHSIVHGRDAPSPGDLEQIWIRTEPLFEMMLSDSPK